MEISSLREIIYSAAALQGIFLATLLFRTQINQPANKVLSLLLLLLSFHLVLVGFDKQEFFMSFPHLSRISWIIGATYWPLIFLFIQYLTGTKSKNFFKSYGLFIPFVVLFAIMLPYYVLSAEEKRAILINYEAASQQDFGWINQTMSVLHLIFQGFFIWYYVRTEKIRATEFAAIEQVRIVWLKRFLQFIFIATVIAVISFYSRAWNIPVLSDAYIFHFIGVVFLFYWLSYKALTQPVLFGLTSDVPISESNQATEPTLTQREKYSRSSLNEQQLKETFQLIRDGFERERLHVKTDLTLSSLAAHINTSRHQVSQAISTQYAGNFFDLVNDYRVEEFKRRATQPEARNLTLLGIAQEAGFSSKATFYSVFKKKTGMTPAEYLEKGA